MRSEYLLALGAVLSLVGGGVAALGAFRQARERADFNEALAAKNRQIADVTTRTLASVTGGESFVYLQPLRRGRQVTYLVRQDGEHPTFDVVVRVQDGGGDQLMFGPASVGTMKRGSGMDWTKPLPPWPFAPVQLETAPQRVWPLQMPWPLAFNEPPSADAQAVEFRVELAARNGIVVQRLKVWPEGGRWHTESRNIERARERLPLPADFDEAQEQDQDGNRLRRP